VGGFPTEESAKAARDAARVAARRGEFVNRSGLTVTEYPDQWLAGHALEVKPKTHEDYRALIATYVAPRIGSMRLQAVRPWTLSGLYRTLLAEGNRKGGPLSPRTVRYVHAVLRKAFHDAVVADQLIPSNPAERAKRPRSSSSVQIDEVWDAAELATFLREVETHRLFPYFRLAAFTGARRGELLHLRWNDVDLDGDEPSIQIRGSASIVRGHRVEGTTKSGRTRRVTLDARTVEVLRSHRERQGKEREVAAGSWHEGDHVFRLEIGRPLAATYPGEVMREAVRAFNAKNAAHPLPTMRLHDLRHIHATLLLRAGVPVHVVAARLGHADPAITLRVYAHVLRDQASEVAQVFASVVDSEHVANPRVSKSVSQNRGVRPTPGQAGGRDLR